MKTVKIMLMFCMGLFLTVSCEKDRMTEPEKTSDHFKETTRTMSQSSGIFADTVGTQISVAQAESYINAWKSNNDTTVVAVFIGSEILQDIIDQDSCTGIWFHFAEHSGENTLVAVGGDANGDDMTEGIIANRSFRPYPCPCGYPCDCPKKKLAKPPLNP